MRVIKLFLLFVIAIVLAVMSFANNQTITLNLVPPYFDDFMGVNGMVNGIELPLYVVIFGGVMAGLVLGYIFEWLREHKHRKEAGMGRQSKAELEAQLRKMKAEANAGRDELLVLVEETAVTAR